jgi:hypothetical protein
MVLDRQQAVCTALGLLQMKVATAEQSQQTDNDQIDRDDIVQQSRHHKDQNASDQ